MEKRYCVVSFYDQFLYPFWALKPDNFSFYLFQKEKNNHALLITGQTGIGKSVCTPCNYTLFMHVMKWNNIYCLPANKAAHFLKWLIFLLNASAYLKLSLMLYHLLGNCPCDCIPSWSHIIWVENTYPDNLARAFAQLRFRYSPLWPFHLK